MGLILDQLKLVIDYTGSSILTIEGDGLVFLDHRGSVPQEQLVRLHFPLEHLGPIWQTIATGSSILIHDVREETKLAQALRAAMGDLLATTFQYVCSWMAVPLLLRDQVIGMLVLTSSEEQAFTQRHATLALAIANQAAIAIESETAPLKQSPRTSVLWLTLPLKIFIRNYCLLCEPFRCRLLLTL